MRLKQKWTLHVENMGKIKVADIEISPLLFFVGDNNSGKSYLMSLLWGILTIGKDLFPSKGSLAAHYIKCEEWLKSNYGKNIEIDETAQGYFINWFNELLEKNKKELLRRIFNYPIEAGKIRIEKFVRGSHLKIAWVEDAQRFSVKDNTIKFPLFGVGEATKEEIAKMLAYICWNLIMQGLAAPLFTPVVKGKRIGEPIYLPASRTGFMLAKDSLYDFAVAKTFGEVTEAAHDSLLTLPYTDFLRIIGQFDTSQKERFAEVINYIESQVIQGKIEAHKEVNTQIRYIPKGMKKELPFHVASSVVTELSPLLLLLKSGIKFNLLIIEEPEAHLHPQLQLLMARIIIRLVNNGVPVWVTTHSDTIIQHVNNMIKLENYDIEPAMLEKHEIASEDMTKDMEIKMYQFATSVGPQTQIQELTATEDGFVVKTFNDTFYNLLQQTRDFQGD